MASPEQSPDTSDSGSTVGAAGRAVQGWILERFTIGVVLMALVAIAAGLLEATAMARVVAVAVGVVVIVVTLVGWRRHWRDSIMWPAMLACGVAVFAAFALAVTG